MSNYEKNENTAETISPSPLFNGGGRSLLVLPMVNIALSEPIRVRTGSILEIRLEILLF